jgi:hypothetical protein
MIQHFHYQTATVPTVFVTKGRQRVKQYNQNVYLRNGDQFELELFNPTNNKVLAKISLNGNSLGSGIILRPGERVFLERYLDDARKFLFETYEVDSNNDIVKNAIKNNGLVEVEFFEEYHPIMWSSGFYTYDSPSWVYYTDNAISDINYGGNTNNINLTGQCQTNSACYYSSTGPEIGSLTNDGLTGTARTKGISSSAPQETGRVEKGAHSNQNFEYDSMQFNPSYTWKTTWKILPESQKALVQEDLKIFCTNCGTRRKKTSHKFCPNCGQKF